jgi:CubicO group peptidase (beta-lactamase class C family)
MEMPMKNSLQLFRVGVLGLCAGMGVAPGAGHAAQAATPTVAVISDAVQRHIDAGEVPGAIVLVKRQGHLSHFEARGTGTASTVLRRDTVLWVASMTKPLVATSVMMMVEAGKVSLDDPVSRFIPEFAPLQQVRVLRPGSPLPNVQDPNAPKAQYDLVAAQHVITVRELLTHTAGLQSIGVPNDSLPTLNVGDTLASFVPKLARSSLEFQPGSKWAYSNATGFDVLARIVEIASGETYFHFAQRHILDPLGMKSTSFGPKPALARRTLAVDPAMASNPCINGKTYACGSAGLWTSAEDYGRFAQMLLDGGTANGHRLIKSGSVAQMSINQTGQLFGGSSGVPGADHGVGFGLSMVTVFNAAAAGLAVPDGSYGWDGVGTRRFWVIPSLRTVIVILVPSGNAAPLHRDVERAAVAALSGR